MSHSDVLPITHPRPLDSSMYDLQGTELAFYEAQTGISDPEKLKQHILKVQAKAYSVYPYPCIRRFSFLSVKISMLPGYKEALKLLETRKDPIFLDLGCCFGNDLRKAVSDGWPVHAAIGSDLRSEYWDYGHELFNTSPTTFPALFLRGDIFDPSFCPSPGPQRAAGDGVPPITPIDSTSTGTQIHSLHPLSRKISAIHASSFFHLFPEQKQLALARILGLSLLSSEPGSIIFGRHIANDRQGLNWEDSGTKGRYEMYCHSPESWKKMWVEDVFNGNGIEAEVVADLIPAPERKGTQEMSGDEVGKRWLMRWYVQRL